MNIISIANEQFYLDNRADIDALVVGVGNFKAVSNDLLVILKGVDLTGFVGADVYTIPLRDPVGEDRHENNSEYGNRIDNDLNSAINRVLAVASFDVVVLHVEYDFDIIRGRNNWPMQVELQ